MDKQSARLSKIFNTIKAGNAATIRELAEMLQVSEMTIRRDLSLLAKDNMVKLIHGGAVLNPGSVTDGNADGKYSLIDQSTLRKDEKRRIGRKAAELLEPNDIAIIDAGSTTEYLAKQIPDNLPITVLCYTLNTLLEVYRKKACKLIFAGGYFHENTLMFESKEGIQLINSVRANKAFLSMSGIHRDLGITTTNHYEIETKQAIMSSSLQKILMADSSKFGKVAAAYYAEIKDFDVIITDSGIPREYERIILDSGVTLYIV